MSDITLRLDDVSSDDVIRVWQALQTVAQGFILDGRDVSLWSTPSTFETDDDMAPIWGDPSTEEDE